MSSEAAHQPLEITVFESTTDISELKLLSFEAFFIFIDEDSMVIQESWQVINEGNKTVVASDDGTGILEVIMPPNAYNLGFSEYSSIQDLQLTETGFVINQTLIPGNEGDYLIFAYEIPYTNKYEWYRDLPIVVMDAQAFLRTDTVDLKGSNVEFV